MSLTFAPQLQEKLHASGIVAVLTIEEIDHAIPLAKALLAGGIDTMELTLRTPAALGALARIRAEVPEMVAGVGTILTVEQVEQAYAAGAAFGVSPGFNPNVVKAATERGFSFAPGVLTPTDIEAALELGCRLMKFFPAEPSGGLAYLKSMAAPYLHLGLRFIPLGGLNENTLTSYIADPLVAAVGGSWLSPKDRVAAKDWATITKLAAAAVKIIRVTRSN